MTQVTFKTTTVHGTGNDRAYVPPGTPIKLPDADAKQLIARGLATEYQSDSPAPVTVAATKSEPKVASDLLALLDGNVETVIKNIREKSLSADQVEQLLNVEAAEQNRKGVGDALRKMQAELEEPTP